MIPASNDKSWSVAMITAISLVSIIGTMSFLEVTKPLSPQQQHANAAKQHYQTARDFAQAAAGSDNAKAGVCSHLKSVKDEMIAGDLSYMSIDTTEEKFRILSNRFGCGPS